MTIVAGRDYFRCDYCDSFHFPPGAGEDGVCLIGESSGLDCPACASPLEDGRIEGEPVQYCGRCRGLLATNPVFGTIVRKRRAKRPVGDSTHAFCPTELNRKLDCPRCRKRMDAHPFYGGGRVVVDTCAACGLIWLDAGELTIIETHNPLPLVREQTASPSPIASADDSDDLLSAFMGWRIGPW